MSNSPVLQISDVGFEWRKSGADLLREIADKVEAGEISEYVLAGNEVSERGYISYGHFDDRWKLLGAIEYAKFGIIRT